MRNKCLATSGWEQGAAGNEWSNSWRATESGNWLCGRGGQKVAGNRCQQNWRQVVGSRVVKEFPAWGDGRFDPVQYDPTRSQIHSFVINLYSHN